jgi:D-3-phosphoglycerate dehydrogenase
MQKVLITDPIHPDALEYMKKAGLEVDLKTNLSPSEIKDCISRYEALICRTSTKLTADILGAADNLKCIGVHATGWDHIDTTTAKEKNILLLGYPSDKESVLDSRHNGSFVPVSEYILMTMLATTKRLIEANESMKNEKWEKYSLSGGEIYGKTLGIIGLGRIGSLVADRAKAFGMEVIAYHPRVDKTEIEKRGATSVSLEELYKKSDFITIHVPKKQENIGLIDSTAFKAMQKRPVIINTSRAAIIKEEDLVKALFEDKIKAVVLDVFDNVPDGINWELVKNPKVIATPHIAGVSDESLKRVSTYVTGLVTDYLINGKIGGLINN